jgi:murein DD-endopeptidase MepM/ murein hydrolase activator NlpD
MTKIAISLSTLLSGLSVISLVVAAGLCFAQDHIPVEGYDLHKTGLIPRYPDGHNCSPLTSLYASWDDVDGTKRNEPHSGVDGGRLGDPILAPAPGSIRAAWKANWGWGEEGALLLRHTREELGLKDGPEFFYSEFDHLRLRDAQSFTAGDRIVRGQQLATVYRPGGNPKYLPEVHWEVWELSDDVATTWHLNKYRGRYWLNPTAHLVDPLYMLSRNLPPRADGSVLIQPFSNSTDYATFKGFTYILPCAPS